MKSGTVIYRLGCEVTRALIFGFLADLLDRQRGALLPWVPVLLALGIGGYFALPAEPPLALSLGLGTACLGLLAVFREGRTGALPVLGLAIVGFGLALASVRAHSVGAPVLEYRSYGPIEGRIVALDRSLSDRLRMTLDRVRMRGLAADRTPARVRIALHSKLDDGAPAVGSTVILTGHLSPPQGPAEPGGFDFQRHAWFLKLGGVGYTRTPVMVWAPPDPADRGTAVARMRFAIADAVRAAIPGDAGGFAAAVLTGDRSGIDRATMDALRASNLAHLLAISGLHMGLLTGFVFAAVRLALAAWPWAALRLPTKKIAAVAALAGGAFYLSLSGGSVATERAFIMVSVMLLAVLMDRRALTIRAVAVAAVIVLCLRPESLLSPGFQMSFAATTALVVTFRAIRDWESRRVPRSLRPVLGLIVSSAVAGAATAPIGAVHFNQVPHFGLLANFLSVPLMGTVVIPAAVLAALLYPLGLAPFALWVMAQGTRWILGVATWVASFDGAVSHVPTPPAATLPVIALGALFLVLWQGRGRLIGLPVAVAGLALWGATDRPDILISGTGGLVGIAGAEGRVISKPRGEGFVARSWLENDGQPVSQKVAADRGGFTGKPGNRLGAFGGLAVAHLTGKGAAEALPAACETHDLVITTAFFDAVGCRVFDASLLRETGALALYLEDGKLRVVTARDASGRRLWNGFRR